MFWHNFEFLCNREGKAPNSIASEIGIASGTISLWRNDHSKTPSPKKLKQIADHFHVTTEWLLADHVDSYSLLSDDEKELIHYFREMNDSGKISALLAVKGLSEQGAFKKERDIAAEH